MKQILILGAGVMQLPAIREAKNLGLRVIVVDANDKSIGVGLADQFGHIDLKDREAILAFARKLDDPVDAVFTAGTDFSSIVAYLSGELGLYGHTLDSAENANYKDKMREAFRKHNVSSPKFIVLDSDWSNNLWPGIDKLDVVVKPVDSMGGRGVIRIKDDKLISNAVKEARKYSRSGKVIVEEFIGGKEYSIDSLVVNGNVIICGIADRHIYYPPYFIEMGHTLPAILTTTEETELVKVFIDGVKALGLSHGAAKGDMKIYKGKAYVGEIAARLSGGYMSGWTLPYANGINITREAIRLALGETSLDLEPKFNKYSAEKAFISIPGKIVSIENVKEAENLTGIKAFFIRHKVGDEVDFPKNNVEKSGNVIAVASTRSEAEYLANEARKKIFLRLEAPNKATSDFLFGQTTLMAFNNDIEYNGLTYDEVLLRYKEITNHSYLDYNKEEKDRFFIAIQVGGLQGAVWFFDAQNS